MLARGKCKANGSRLHSKRQMTGKPVERERDKRALFRLWSGLVALINTLFQGAAVGGSPVPQRWHWPMCATWQGQALSRRVPQRVDQRRAWLHLECSLLLPACPLGAMVQPVRGAWRQNEL